MEGNVTKYLEFHKVADQTPMMDGLGWMVNEDGQPVVIDPGDSKAWARFRMSIRTQGLINPIIVWDGKIVDGRNRYAACLVEGVKPKFQDISKVVDGWGSLTDEQKYGKAEDLAIYANSRRDHYTPIQRALVCMPLYDRMVGKPSVNTGKGETKAKVAGIAGVSVSVVRNARAAYRYYGPQTLQAALEFKVGADEMSRLRHYVNAALERAPTERQGTACPAGSVGSSLALKLAQDADQRARLDAIRDLDGGAKDGDTAKQQIVIGKLTAAAQRSAGKAAGAIEKLAKHVNLYGWPSLDPENREKIEDALARIQLAVDELPWGDTE